MNVPDPRRWRRERRRAKIALGFVLLVGAVASVTVGGVWAALSGETTNVGGSFATGTMTLNDYANYSTTTLNGAITNSQTSITVASATGFPTAASYTIQIDNEQMLVTGGQGTTTWTVTRGVNGTSAASHLNNAGVATAACSTIGNGASGNVNASCDSIIGYSASTENYPGTLATRSVQITDSGSIGASDLTMWMPSCLRGVTPDASWASKTTSVSSYTNASTSTGHLAGAQTYYYEITAVVGGTEQVAGAETTYTPPNGTSTNAIQLNWTAVTNATAYKIYRSTVEGQEQLLASPAGTGTTYTDNSATSPSGYPPAGAGSGNPCGQELTTTLNGALTAGATSLTVSSHAGFPTDPNGNYRILVYDSGGTNLEYMTVTAGQGTNNWTVTRGVGGTSATSKTDGDTVVLLDDAQFYVQESGSTTLADAVGVSGASTLNGAITNNQTSITVASAAGFPSSGNYTIQVDNEEMRVTGGQGTTTWTVTRGYNGTTAAAHSDTTAVNQDITVTSPSGFPTSLPYTITVGTEQMRVTRGQGTNAWLVTRAYNSTTAVAHNANDTVTWNYCWYPVAANGTCAFDTTSDLGQFAGQYNASTSTLDFGPGQLAGNSRKFTFGFEVPNYASNTMQGTEALFTLRWHAQS